VKIDNVELEIGKKETELTVLCRMDALIGVSTMDMISFRGHAEA